MTYKTEPRPYQRAIVEKSWKMPYLALFLEQGLGKTKVVLDSAAHQYKEGMIDCLIVVSRTQVVANWAYEEVGKHLGIPHQVVHYTSEGRAKVTPVSRMLKNVLKVVLINDGCVRTQHGYNYLKQLVETYRCALVVDESTLIKTPNTTITRRLMALAPKTVIRRILCGEPAPQGPQDYYSQYKFLHPQVLGVSAFMTYKHLYCEMEEVWSSRGRHERPLRNFKPGMKEVFEAKVAHCTIRLRKTDVLPDLPEKQYITVKFDLKPEVRRAYDRLRDEFWTEMVIQDSTRQLTATIAISRVTRLHQLVCGSFVDDQGNVSPVDSGKYDALKSILDERPEGAKTIIWAHYRADIETVARRLNQDYGPGSAAYIYGGMADKDRQMVLHLFKNDPKCRWLVANPATAGWGLTLTEADCNVYYSNSYNWEHRVQSEDRTHRIGQAATSVLYYDLVAVGTVEENIIEVLNEKADFSKSVLNNLSKWFT